MMLKQLQRWDERRDGVPGEHWAVLGTGVALLRMASPGRSSWLRMASAIAGLALIWRAASGREGIFRQGHRLELNAGQGSDQREALKQSTMNATTGEPQNFREEANAKKLVEIPPDKEDAPIQGLDPEDRGRKAR